MPCEIDQLEKLVAPVLRSHLRRRVRALAFEHDDLVQQTLEDLLRYLLGRGDDVPPEEDWPALGLTILRRRVADRVHDSMKKAEWSVDEPDAEAPDPHAQVDEVVQYRRLLATVLRLVTQLSPVDQTMLLEEISEISGSAQPLNGTERKHLTRLRNRLRLALREEFGVPPEDYFGS